MYAICGDVMCVCRALAPVGRSNFGSTAQSRALIECAQELHLSLPHGTPAASSSSSSAGTPTARVKHPTVMKREGSVGGSGGGAGTPVKQAKKTTAPASLSAHSVGKRSISASSNGIDNSNSSSSSSSLVVVVSSDSHEGLDKLPLAQESGDRQDPSEVGESGQAAASVGTEGAGTVAGAAISTVASAAPVSAVGGITPSFWVLPDEDDGNELVDTSYIDV